MSCSCRFIHFIELSFFFVWLCLWLLLFIFKIESVMFISMCQFNSLSHGVFKQFHHLKWWHLYNCHIFDGVSICFMFVFMLFMLYIVVIHCAATTFRCTIGISVVILCGNIQSTIHRTHSDQKNWHYYCCYCCCGCSCHYRCNGSNTTFFILLTQSYACSSGVVLHGHFFLVVVVIFDI